MYVCTHDTVYSGKEEMNVQSIVIVINWEAFHKRLGVLFKGALELKVDTGMGYMAAFFLSCFRRVRNLSCSQKNSP